MFTLFIILTSLFLLATAILSILALASLIFPRRFSYGRDIRRGRLFSYYVLAAAGCFVLANYMVMQTKGTRSNDFSSQTEPPVLEANQIESIIENDDQADIAITEDTFSSTERITPPERINYSEIRRNLEQMTQAQFKVFTEAQRGKILYVNGYVADVRKKLFGGYEVWIDVDNPQGMSVQEVYFDADESFAMRLTRNEKIDCKGTITSIYDVLGIGQVLIKDASCW